LILAALVMSASRRLQWQRIGITQWAFLVSNFCHAVDDFEILLQVQASIRAVPAKFDSDDGSQISIPGPPLSFEAALQLLGTPAASVLSQSGEGRRIKSLRSGLRDIAVVYVSGRPDFDEALTEAVLQYTPLGGIFKVHGKVPDNFIGALDYAFKRFPTAKWYYIADDDSFVHLGRLVQLASTFDATSKQNIGHRDCAGDSCPNSKVNCKRETMLNGAVNNPGWACGGPGVLMSRPLVEAMSARSCKEYYGQEPAPVCCGDMALACCAFDAWEGLQISNVPSFNPGAFGKALANNVAVHHITPNTTIALGKVYNLHMDLEHTNY